MSSGASAEGDAQVAAAADGGAGRAAEGDGLGAIEAVSAGGAGAAGATLGRAGAGALAAVEAASTVAHGRLPAGTAAGPRLRPAAWRLQVVAGGIAVPQSAPIGNDADRAARVG